MNEVILVGSGAAGVAAALQLADRGIRPLLLDVGHRGDPAAPRADANLYAYRRAHDTFALQVGERYQGLSNLLRDRTVPVKLTTPNAEYVTREAAALAPVDEAGFCAIQSFATGGLANAWGAGLYRFTDRDLEEFPIAAADLDPYFDRLTREIGISGERDDLESYLGTSEDFLPPVRLGYNSGRLYESYRRRRDEMHRMGIRMGRPQIAALTRPHDGRPALSYTNLEFWQDSPAIYSPRYTLDKLVAAGSVDYQPGRLVESWRESDTGVTVRARDARTGETSEHQGRFLLLAAGAINTSRIVLQSFADTSTRLTLYENPALQLPFVLPRSLGRPLETDAFGLVQLNMVWESETFGDLLQGSIMEITSPMRAEFFASLPYTMPANFGLVRHLLPAMIVMQLYLPGWRGGDADLSLEAGGRLRIEGRPNPFDPGRTGPLLKAFRRMGAWTHPRLLVRVPTGHGIHYAGTLPMKRDPGRYECDPSGRLSDTRSVYVADSASFTRLPAKNMSFGMMGNAMRIADGVARRLQEES